MYELSYETVYRSCKRMNVKTFVFADIKEALSNAESVNEVNWAITLTHHLLRNLAVNQTYVIDNHYPGRSPICVCCKQNITGRFGDTSFGRLTLF